MVDRREAADCFGEPERATAGIGDGAAARDIYLAIVFLAAGVSGWTVGERRGQSCFYPSASDCRGLALEAERCRANEGAALELAPPTPCRARRLRWRRQDT